MEDDETLHWHALNYRTAATQHAEAMWQELTAFVDRKVAAAIAEEREALAALCDGLRYRGYVPPEERAGREYYKEGAQDCADLIRARSAPRTQEGACTKILGDGKPCGLVAPCPDCGRAVHDVPEGG